MTGFPLVTVSLIKPLMLLLWEELKQKANKACKVSNAGVSKSSFCLCGVQRTGFLCAFVHEFLSFRKFEPSIKKAVYVAVCLFLACLKRFSVVPNCDCYVSDVESYVKQANCSLGARLFACVNFCPPLPGFLNDFRHLPV
jgi:hypothetical protein